MTPYLHEHDEVITMSYFLFQPRIGDVIVFKHVVPPFVFCKRITKIAGDEVWVEGENRKVSIDSRKFGYVEKKNIIGKVILKI